ncbi:hypothetical protein [Streptomyces sp. 142MFCol3.1]|uniref:hypothetical protein n=1 Tax=Streptomyces sp. 142MFCol3.1 TaxID=1172179 RepID=UPI0007C56B9F|nr:hypothetical protein [Streptomyces sp. 142MFCol3.1]
MSLQASTTALTRPADTGSPVLPHPATALVTNRPDDLAVVDAAVRLAAPRMAPVLLVAVLPIDRRVAAPFSADVDTVRMFLARVSPPLRAARVGYIPVAHRTSADGGGQLRLRAAGGVPALAARHHSPLGVRVHPGTGRAGRARPDRSRRRTRRPLRVRRRPHPMDRARNRRGLGPADLSPAGCATCGRSPNAACRIPAGGGVTNGLTALAPWWLLALVDLVVGCLCLALALRPRLRRTTAVRRPA